MSVSYSSIKIHLAALKFYSLAHGYILGSLSRLYLVVRGIRKSQGARFKKPRRLPVTPDMLKLIKLNLFNSSVVFEDKVMIWAAMLTAFFGLLRVSEYTTSTAKTFHQNK